MLPRTYTFFFFFFNATATTEIYTLSLHDALPICRQPVANVSRRLRGTGPRTRPATRGDRSEEHTSELQSRLHLVCRLLLEKKNNEWQLGPSPDNILLTDSTI